MATYIEMTAPGGFAPHDQAHINWERGRQRHAAHRVAQPRPGPRDDVRADRFARCSASRWSAFRLRTAEPEYNLRRQPDRRLAHAARPGQRDALRLAGDREERHEPRRRAPRERGAGHRVRDGRLPDQGHRPQGADRRAARRSIPGKLDLDFTDRPKVPAHLPERLPHRRGGDRPGDRRDARSCPTSPATTSATSSTTRSSKARCRAASRRARAQSSSSRRVYDAVAASCSPAASWTTPCRAPGWSAASACTDHAVPTATNPLGAKGVGEGGVTGSMPALMNAVIGCAAPGRRAALRHAGHPAPGVAGAASQADYGGAFPDGRLRPLGAWKRRTTTTLPPTTSRSSWSAAIAQLPGYPGEAQPPQAPTGPVREVSMGTDHEEDHHP